MGSQVQSATHTITLKYAQTAYALAMKHLGDALFARMHMGDEASQNEVWRCDGIARAAGRTCIALGEPDWRYHH